MTWDTLEKTGIFSDTESWIANYERCIRRKSQAGGRALGAMISKIHSYKDIVIIYTAS